MIGFHPFKRIKILIDNINVATLESYIASQQAANSNNYKISLNLIIF